ALRTSIMESCKARRPSAMPVRFLNSSVLAWPDKASVEQAVRSWILQERTKHPELLRMAYFGSYARGDYGVGSDLDLIAIVSASSEYFHRRPLSWDLLRLPVPSDLLVYTEEEWNRLMQEDNRFVRTLRSQAVWVYPAP